MSKPPTVRTGYYNLALFSPPSLLRSALRLNSNNNMPSPAGQSPGPVVLSGSYKKLKGLKRKYFVLRGEAPGHPACLEYYDSKKKYENKHPPKRSITVRSCFNINHRKEIKNKNVIALFTKDDCFCMVMDTLPELQKWLQNLLLLQNGDQPDKEQRLAFGTLSNDYVVTNDHVWEINMQKKGLGERKNILGIYNLCLNNRKLCLMDVKTEKPIAELPLNCIRRSGCMDRIFYMEVGRSAVTGGGEFWMEVEDSNIAQNMHRVINDAMVRNIAVTSSTTITSNVTVTSNAAMSSGVGMTSTAAISCSIATTSSNSVKDEGPRQRVRSSSANEASKPISVIQRRHTTQKLQGFINLENQRMHEEQVEQLQEQNNTASALSQSSQSQTTSTTNTQTAAAADGVDVTEIGTVHQGTIARVKGSAAAAASAAVTSWRRHSVASHPIPSANNISQSVHANKTPSPSSGTTITSTTATISHQRTLSLPLAAVAINQSQSSKRSLLRCVPMVRDRCDSLPSRARTTSEGPLTIGGASFPGHQQLKQQHAKATGHLVAHGPRPLSMHSRGLSYSPPVGSMPISPASAACSTDSAGSSLSIDDASSENVEDGGPSSKYGHSLTPDEPVILEENGDDYVPWSADQQLKFTSNLKSCSPSQQPSSYVEMYSPCSSSPGRGAYMPMSPATGAHSHSRTSSLAEESTMPDGFVAAPPAGDDGYVDMDPPNPYNGHFPDDASQHGGSSCSVTSGTPSTDMRFSEYHLDKVTSFLAPGEDLQARPTRAYSVGSRPEPANRNRKNRIDIAQQESSRVRAFSVGSRSKRPEIGRFTHVVTAPLVAGNESSHSHKSNSAPLLSSSWGHNSGCSNNSERMEDLMELDFTRPNAPVTFSSPPSSYSQSQPYSTATDTSSYVDMSPGQPPISATAPYVDMNGQAKANRNNSHNNNNNNIATANHNHNQNLSLVMVSTHKPVITQVSTFLKPVEEAETSYAKMDGPLDDWTHSRISPKQVPSPCQDDYMQMSGPPGVMRTAPVDLPQPRQQVEGYVDMSFKSKSSIEQDYINASMGIGRNHHKPHDNRKKKCSLPIAIQRSVKSPKVPNFLPLNGSSPSLESLGSTPASPPCATPMSLSSTIFPFSLNSPQSPVKPFIASQADSQKSSSIGDVSSAKSECTSTLPTARKISAPSPLPGVDGCPSSKKPHDNSESPVSANLATKNIALTAKPSNPVNLNSSNSLVTSTVSKEPLRLSNPNVMALAQEQTFPLNPITKKLSDLSVSKPRLVTASPTTSPTPSSFKQVQLSKPASPKIIDDVTPTPTPTPSSTPTSTPSPLDSEGYEKLQPGATLLHYASLDLPEVSGAPPVSPTPAQEGFKYAKIDFVKLKQN